MLSDLDLPALWEYRSGHRDPAGFDAFWGATLTEARAAGDGLTLTPVPTELRTVDVFDAEFPGFGGHPVRGWLRLPRDRGDAPLPAVVQFHGYGSGRGGPYDDLVWASAGYAHLIVDARGQGGAHAGGSTGDPVGSAPAYPGFLTRGIEDKETYYYRRVFTDAVRAVDAVRSLGTVDERRVAVAGNSQGGGIALAAAGLLPDLAAAYFQAPFLADVRRAVRITASAPYSEITGYLAARRSSVEAVFHTLDHFDGVAFARRALAPAHFSTGLTDDVCPPSTTFGAYHAYRGPKTIRAWEFNGHEAGGHDDVADALSAFRAATAKGEEER
ncbi:acetylxylan esterase [Streptomyces sp. NBC_01497]|uniref:acetylxylan esterase n=1 Tax=Streptomyces sp. NBC_01497 TaxID=2903885 RepID=UPI002E35AC09|nr:acetylxylan esterase [Streptomyces sp. NBC_01497]